LLEKSFPAEENLMQKVVLALLAAAALGLAALSPAEAVGTRYPFCLQGNDSPRLSNCSFTTYEQCQATASGRQLSTASPTRIMRPAASRALLASGGRRQVISIPATERQTERR
jgi:hypothetical protein